MDDLLRVVVQWLHVTGGVLWIGGGFYVVFVQLPALEQLPPAARGPALAAIAPKQIRYILRVAEFTMTLGVVNLLVGGRARQLTEPLASRWALTLLVGIVLAVGLYASARALTKPLVGRLLAAGPRAAAGDAAAAAQVPVLRERLRRIGLAQVTVGAIVILAMVATRFS